jgi:histidinol dehydrogenase
MMAGSMLRGHPLSRHGLLRVAGCEQAVFKGPNVSLIQSLVATAAMGFEHAWIVSGVQATISMADGFRFPLNIAIVK